MHLVGCGADMSGAIAETYFSLSANEQNGLHAKPLPVIHISTLLSFGDAGAGGYLYGRGMAQESISLSALTELKYQRMRVCSSKRRRSDAELVYALPTALELLAIEKPKLPERMRFKDKMYVVVSDALRRSHVDGVSFIVWQGPIETVTVERRFVCTSPACTWAMMSAYLSVAELAILGDSMMRRDNRLKRATFEDFIAFLKRAEEYCQESVDSGQRRKAFKGIRNCYRALRPMRENSDSSFETRTRLALMRYGLPCPQVNYAIRNPHTNKAMLLNMAYPEYSIAIEYDGGDHAGQWLADTSRRQAIQDAGWEYIQVTKLNLGDEEQEERLARRVAEAIHRATGWPVALTDRQSIRQLSDGRRDPRCQSR